PYPAELPTNLHRVTVNTSSLLLIAPPLAEPRSPAMLLLKTQSRTSDPNDVEVRRAPPVPEGPVELALNEQSLIKALDAPSTRTPPSRAPKLSLTSQCCIVNSDPPWKIAGPLPLPEETVLF